MTFTSDEMNLICIYDTSDKAELEKQLRLSVPYIENAELREITETVINKLERMTAEEFEQTEFIPTVTAEDMED
ncbi:MAG: transposon-transfer assisting family protein [Clostridiales bacterium]|nr:transposon-transfer assisting family protein [Clostridiales bacterium]